MLSEVSLLSAFHLVLYGADNHQEPAGEKQVTSEARAHTWSHGHWAVLAEMAGCRFPNHLTHERLLITNLNNASASPGPLISMTMMDGEGGGRWNLHRKQ